MMPPPRVLIVLDASAAWSRGILRGFARIAHGQGWTLLHYHEDVDFEWLASEWPLDAAVLGPYPAGPWPEQLRNCISVSVNANRQAEGIASVSLAEVRIAELALDHLRNRGFQRVTTFRFDRSPFGQLREQHFREAALREGMQMEPEWWTESAATSPMVEHPNAIKAWLESLERPCGIFCCCDAWARVVARYARAANLRVPEDLALVGVDNDVVECEIQAPPLSSVAVPWRMVGESAARLVSQGLRGESISDQHVVVAPLDVIARRSSDTLAVQDPLVAAGLAWIHEHAGQRLSVPEIAHAVETSRQRLERHFRRELGRTVLEEIRRVRVEIARGLLVASEAPLREIAKHSGFTNAALLSVAFSREVGVPPGAYRRRARDSVSVDDD